MTSEQLTETLRRVDPAQQADLDRLAMAVRNQSRDLTRTLVRLWVGQDVVLARKAALVLSLTEELALGPLSELRDSVGPEAGVWRMRSLVEGELQLRERMLGRLDPLFDDRTPVPLPQVPGGAEEPTMPRRVCDEAYLLVRRMLNPQEGSMRTQMNSRAFLGLTEKERDVEIGKARRTRQWSQFVEDVEE